MKYILFGTLAFLLITILLPSFTFSMSLIGIFFIIANVLMIYAVYSILKFGKPSSKKFDNGEWYEDAGKGNK